MPIGSLSYSVAVGLSVVAADQQVGTDYGPTQNNTNITGAVTIGTGAANNALGGGDEMASSILTIAPSGSATVDLTVLTDILGFTGASLARCKAIVIRLLSPTNDTVNGTLASFITIGNNGSNDFVSQSGSGWFNGATSKFDVPNGGALAWFTPSAAGTPVDGTHKIIKIVNGDSSLSAKVQPSIGGGST